MSHATSLPIAEVLDEVVAALKQEGRLVLAAPPGAGKTTGVPPTLIRAFPEAGRVLLLQPRRMAARAVAARLADLQGTEVGQKVGYQVRMDRRWGDQSQIVVMTYGVLLRRLQSDPFLEPFGTVLLDEFHERTLEADLTLGMLQRVRETVRPELRIVVMSATLDAGPVASFLDDAPMVESRGRSYPVDVRYTNRITQDRIEDQVAQVLPRALAATAGHVLVFLPGVGEIRRTARRIAGLPALGDAELLELYGDLSPQRQDQVLRQSGRRKVVLSTNVAETSVTIEGVTAVIDSGLARVMRINPAIGLPRLDIEPISRAAADQRAGRAGRTAPGVCFRLWMQATHRSRAEFDTPEIHRGDLAGAVLQLLGWGERDVMQFPWLTPPRADSVAAAMLLLEQLGAIAAGKITAAGRDMLRVPAHPRLARLLVSARQRRIVRRASICAAMLSERDPFEDRRRGRLSTHDAQLLGLPSASINERAERIEQWLDGREDRAVDRSAGQMVRRAAEQLAAAVERGDEDGGAPSRHGDVPHDAASPLGGAAPSDAAEIDAALGRSLLDAFPDRLARRRERGGDRGVMVGGHGVRLKDSTMIAPEGLFLCIDVLEKGRDSEVRLAAPVEEEWLAGPGLREVDECFFNPTQRRVVGRRRRYWYDLMLSETPTEVVDRQQAAELLLREVRLQWERAFPADDAELMQLIARTQCVRQWMPEEPIPVLDEAAIESIAAQLCEGRVGIDEVRGGPWLVYAREYLGYEALRRLDQLAPRRLQVPSGNEIAIDYAVGKPPALAVRLQELFGWTETPRVAGNRVPLLLRLLAPNYREVQVTSDLASFWKTAYGEVRKELRRRYPKHHWPDDPLQASASRSGLKPK